MQVLHTRYISYLIFSQHLGGTVEPDSNQVSPRVQVNFLQICSVSPFWWKLFCLSLSLGNNFSLIGNPVAAFIWLVKGKTGPCLALWMQPHSGTQLYQQHRTFLVWAKITWYFTKLGISCTGTTQKLVMCAMILANLIQNCHIQC